MVTAFRRPPAWGGGRGGVSFRWPPPDQRYPTRASSHPGLLTIARRHRHAQTANPTLDGSDLATSLNNLSVLLGDVGAARGGVGCDQ
jgi:hypothetical protein